MSTLLIAITLSLFVSDAEDWEYQPGIGFVNSETMEKKDSDEFYLYGVSLATQRKIDESVAVLDLLLRHDRDRKRREKALFARGEILWSANRYYDAYRTLDVFLREIPESKLAEKAKRLEMDSALYLAKEKYTNSFWSSIPLVGSLARSSKTGLEYLRMSLQRYPREPFSSLYYYKMADFLFQEGDLDGATNELKFLLEEYPNTAEVPKGILLLGKIGLKKFDSIDYDIDGLKEARRNFSRFVEEAPAFSKFSEDAATFVRETLPFVKEKLSFIREKEAEKEYRVGDYYYRKGFLKAARIYFDAVQKRFPETSWGRKAGEKLSEMKP